MCVKKSFVSLNRRSDNLESVTILDNTIAPTIADRIARAFGFASFGGTSGKHAAIIETKRSIPWEIAWRASFSASRSSLPTDGSGHDDSKLSRCFVEREP